MNFFKDDSLEEAYKIDAIFKSFKARQQRRRMNLPFKLALKYFGEKISFKRFNSIHLLSIISLLVATIVTTAAIVIMSVMNGLMSLVGDLSNQFFPELKVEPSIGKVVDIDSMKYAQIQDLEHVLAISEVLEEVAMFEYNGNQVVGTVKGVDENYTEVSGIANNLVRGEFVLKDSTNNAIIGLGIAQKLAINVRNPFEGVSIFIPQRKKRVSFNPAAMLSSTTVRPVAEFAIQKDYDDKYVFVPIEAIRPLLNYPTEVSYLEIKTTAGKGNLVERQIQDILGGGVDVLNKNEQNKSWNKVMKFEKWAAFAILTFIMLIASFNMLSSLSMIVMEKKKDISILKSMGLTNKGVGRVFRYQGLLIGLFGAFIGTLLALVLIFLQKKIGLIMIEGNFVVDRYPVTINWLEVALIIGVVLLISWLASILPSLRAQKQQLLVD